MDYYNLTLLYLNFIQMVKLYYILLLKIKIISPGLRPGPGTRGFGPESILSLTDLETLYIQSFKMESLFNFKFEAQAPGRGAKTPQLFL